MGAMPVELVKPLHASPLAFLGKLKLLPLEVNDLYAFPDGQRTVPIRKQIRHVWRIPLIKRSATTLCFVLFLITFVLLGRCTPSRFPFFCSIFGV